MPKKNTPPDDTYQIRCPKLGHQIYFSYCRQENMGLPCFKTLDCWYIHFQVMDYLKNELTVEEWQESFEKPAKPKMLSLVEILEQVQKRSKENK
jgi:hypothetical protein